MATNVIDKIMKNGVAYQTAYDSTITIQKNGSTVDSFTTNASSGKTINITVPTNSDYVDLTSAQNVGGVKTFTSAPVVPSKTTAATNTGTAVATEAQVYKKQDSLTLPATPTSGHMVTWGANNKTLVDGGAIPTGFNPGNSGTTDQILRKTASGYEWSNEVGTTYTAGTNIQISNTNVISATDTTYPTATKTDLDTGTSTTASVYAPKDIADYVKGKLSNTYVYKGTVATYGDLPSTGQTVGDVYNVTAAHTTDPKFPAGSNVAWDGEAWDVLGGVFDTSGFVDTSTNQTIGGTKTFTTSPVVPSKSTAAANTATAIATEAQVYLKQDKLVAGSNIQIAADGKTISATDTTYESKAAASGGTAVSLVTTGEKYTWNNKADTTDIGNATISFTQGGTSIGSLTTNQSSNGTLAFHDNIFVSQDDYDALPSSKTTDGNSYFITTVIS